MVFDVMLQITSGDVDKFYKDIELDRHGAMADPRKWSISRVIKWVKWIEKEYKISGKRFLGKKLNWRNFGCNLCFKNFFKKKFFSQKFFRPQKIDPSSMVTK